MAARNEPSRIAALAFVALAAGSHARAAIYTVTTTADSGAGSLRQAVLDANSNPGIDTIAFNIPGSGVQTITFASEIDVTDPVVIDGYTQPGSSPNTDPAVSNAVILIDLQGADGSQNGLMVTAGTLEIHGVALRHFATALGFMSGGGSFVGGCFVGPLPSGLTSDGSFNGIASAGTGPDTIGDGTPANRNVISGNAQGVGATNSGGPTIVQGNLIGTNAAGTAALPNQTGILSAVGIQVGGGTAGQGNVISGNAIDGFHETSFAAKELHSIVGNLVGLDATGVSPLGNGGVGIYVDSDSPNITSNVVAANGSHGIDLGNSIFVTVSNNDIGLNVAGSELGNRGAGIHSLTANMSSIVGNTIADNQAGIWMEAPGFGKTFVIGSNQIFENGGLGIIDGSDFAIHPNGIGFPFPVITLITPGATTTNIQGFYDSPGTGFTTIQFFSSPACSKKRPWQFDEGKNYLGSATILGGLRAFSFDASVVLTDEVVTATGTFTETACPPPCPGAPDGGFVTWNQTGQFSQRLPFSISPASGDPAGGVAITIAGTNFAAGATVTLGGLPVGALNVASATEIDATAPALPAGSVGDVTVVNLDGSHGTLQMAYLADFLDVPPANAFHDYVRATVTNGIATGVGGGDFGVDSGTLRQQMAVFLLKAKHGICYTPPPCAGVFGDVPCPSLFADWIEALAVEGITGGCGGGNYCPGDTVRRDQMAAFLLKAEHGSSYVPPPCAGTFGDVTCPSLFADWIEQLATEGVTGGCGNGNYCPLSPNTRGQMAVFLTKTFQLQ